MPRIASFSKLCGHFCDVTGSFIGSRVRGHFILMRSDATARSSEEVGEGGIWELVVVVFFLLFLFLAFAAWVMGVVLSLESVGSDWEPEGNQVEAWGIGGAESEGCWASCTIFLKPM